MTHELRMQLAKDLVTALENNNETKADSLLDEIASLRETQLFQEVGRLTRQLHDTMRSFTLDSKITQFTQNEIPDAKERLNYVITMTEDAANTTLTAVENLMPVSDQLNVQAIELDQKWNRFLDKEMPFNEFKEMSQEITLHFKESRTSLERVQLGLNEILMAQGFQDITGQVIRKVIDLVQNLENSMVEMIKLSGSAVDKEARPEKQDEIVSQESLAGPVVPGVDDKQGGVASSQDEVDDLLSSLGF